MGLTTEGRIGQPAPGKCRREMIMRYLDRNTHERGSALPQDHTGISPSVVQMASNETRRPWMLPTGCSGAPAIQFARRSALLALNIAVLNH